MQKYLVFRPVGASWGILEPPAGFSRPLIHDRDYDACCTMVLTEAGEEAMPTTGFYFEKVTGPITRETVHEYVKAFLKPYAPIGCKFYTLMSLNVLWVFTVKKPSFHVNMPCNNLDMRLREWVLR